MRNTFANHMAEIGPQEPKLVVLVGDISHFALQPFAKACPGRFYNVGILEPTIVSMAAGLAAAGMYPVAHTIAPFLIERSLEQIKLDFCYQGLGGTLISVGSAFDYSGLGCSHHSYSDLALINNIPNTEVVYPASPNEFKILFDQTLKNGKLTYFRLPGTRHGVVFKDEQIAVGRGIPVKAGKDLTILATGPQLRTVMDSLAMFADKGLDVEVLYFPMLKPFDENMLATSTAKTKKLIVIEEHSMHGGFSTAALHASCNIPGVRYEFMTIPDEFQRGYGSYAEHTARLGFTPQGVFNRTMRLFER